MKGRSRVWTVVFFVLLLFAPPILLSGSLVRPAHAQPSTCTTTYDPASNVPDQQLAIASAGVYCFNIGTYDTQITINSSDVLLAGMSDDPSQVVIQPTNLTDNAPDLGSGSPNSVPAIIYAGTGYTNVSVEDLTVDGSLAGSAAASVLPSCDSIYGCYFGILFWGSSGNITGDIVTSVDTSGYTSVPEGVGISVGTPVSAGPPCTSGCSSSNAIISNNEVINYAQNGIECENGGTSCAISDNIVTPQYDSRSYVASNGIEIGTGATGSIIENTISENIYVAGGSGPDLFTQTQAAGIYTDETAGTITVSENTLYDNDVGIRLQRDAGTVSTTSNEIDGSAFVGLAVVDENQSVGGYTFRNEPVGIEAASNALGFPAVVTVGCNTFSRVETPTTTEAVGGGSAQIDQVCLLGAPITPASPKIDSGEAITLTANPSGGTAPYTYQWYSSPGCSVDPIYGATSSTYQASPTSATTYYYGANDSGSPAGSVCSDGDPVTVDPALATPLIAASPVIVFQGHPSLLTSGAVSTGTSPYAYQWFGEAPADSAFSAIAGATSSSYTFSTSGSTATGTWSFELRVNDSAGESAISDAATVDVNATLLAGDITPPSPTINSGDSVTLTANPTGGLPPYTYQWYVGPNCTFPISGANQSTYVASPSVNMTYFYEVNDSNAATACSAGDTVTVASSPPIPAFPFPFAIPVVLAATAAIYVAIRKTVPVRRAVPAKQRTQPRSSPR